MNSFKVMQVQEKSMKVTYLPPHGVGGHGKFTTDNNQSAGD